MLVDLLLFVMTEDMCESPYGNQDFPPLANGITLYQSLRKPHSAMNTGPITYPITKMGVASAFEHTQYRLMRNQIRLQTDFDHILGYIVLMIIVSRPEIQKDKVQRPVFEYENFPIISPY